MSTKLKSIPLCQLKRSSINVRKTDRFTGIRQLAANILEKGLLENLVVRPVADTGGDFTHEVTAGGRRLAALQLLAKREKIERDYPVRCLVRGGENCDAVEVSLAENFLRADLHPADQFEAFAKLAREGTSPDEIGARFGVTPAFVQQRLKLASVSSRLVAVYRKGGMTLEQLTAFTLSDDHKTQEEVWFENPYASLPAQAIRRLLTRSQVEGTDRRARFIGAKAYEEAGGVIVRDLFDTEDEGYFSDSQLLDRLVAEKLETAAASLRAEGWQWVSVRHDPEELQLHRYGRAQTIERTLSKPEEKQLSALGQRYDELVAALEEEGDGAAEDELDKVSAQIDVLRLKKEDWAVAEKARAGAVISLGPDGAVRIVRGMLQPEEHQPHDEHRGKPSHPTGYPASVLLDLSAQRTAALRELLVAKPKFALLLLLQAMVVRLFHEGRGEGCLGIVATSLALERASPSIGESRAGQSAAVRHDQWRVRLPEGDGLWMWLQQLSDRDRSALTAHCIALTVNALAGAAGRADGPQDADVLAATLGLDMAAWWRPTRANFLDRLTKAQILATVTAGVSQAAAQKLSGLKKDSLAAEAEKLLSQTAWLPLPLQAPPPASRQDA